MSIHPRLLSILAIFQVILIVAGFCVTRAILHAHDQIAPGIWGPYAPPVPALALFIRNFGFWFLLIPLAWCAVAATRGEVYRGIVSVPLYPFILGVALTIGLTILLAFSVCLAFQTLTTPLVMVQKTPAH
jgi:hypothetical protein